MSDAFRALLDQTLAGVDMGDEVAKKQAYHRCLDYARNQLNEDPEVNRFLALAADRLGQQRVHLSVIKGRVSLPDGARLHLTYSPQGGPALTGNADGLRYLSALCAALAAAPTGAEDAPAEHVHLYAGEEPLFGDSYGLTLYSEADEWFDKNAAAPEEEVEGDGIPLEYPRREIIPDNVYAVAFQPKSGGLPPPLLLTYGRLYRVNDHRPYQGEGVWTKRLGDEGDERMWIFIIRDDAGANREFALHLDDPELTYFSRGDLEQIIPV